MLRRLGCVSAEGLAEPILLHGGKDLWKRKVFSLDDESGKLIELSVIGRGELKSGRLIDIRGFSFVKQNKRFNQRSV